MATIKSIYSRISEEDIFGKSWKNFIADRINTKKEKSLFFP